MVYAVNRVKRRKWHRADLTFCLLISQLILLSCNGQSQSNLQEKENVRPSGLNVRQRQPANPRVDTILNFNSSVRCIFEDSKGNLWFGSHSEGVCRYDGELFTYFTVEDGLCNNQIRTIQEDEEKNIWFGTGNGPCFFDGTNFTSFNTDEIIKLGKISGSEWKKETGDLWFDGTTESGVFRYDGQALTYLEFSDTIKNRAGMHGYQVFCIYEDRSEKLWFGTASGGVVRYSGENFITINEKDLSATVRAIFQDKEGGMWFGNNGGGVYQYDGKNLTNFTDKQKLGNPDFLKDKTVTGKLGTLARIWTIEQDSFGIMWFGTIDAGVWSYDGTSMTNYTVEDGLPDNSIEAIYKDRSGRLWVGTANGGLCTFNGKSFEKFKANPVGASPAK